MRRLQHLAFTITTAALALGATACTDAGNNLLIIGNDLPTAQNNLCVVNSNVQDGVISSGIYEINAPLLYQMAPIVRNAAPAIADDANQNVALIEGFDIEVNFLGGFLDAVPDAQRQTLIANSKQTVLRSFTVEPNGLASSFIDVFNAPFVAALQSSGVFSSAAVKAQVTVSVTAFGELDGGTIESTPFVYPITLCNGCLVVETGACPATVGGGHPCGFEQDFEIACCRDATNALVCSDEQ